MSSLPNAFAALLPFVKKWALAGEAARAAARSESTPEERQAFYDAAHPLLGTALDYLDTRWSGALAEEDSNLTRIMLSLASVALAVEVLQENETRHSQSRERLIIIDHSAI